MIGFGRTQRRRRRARGLASTVLLVAGCFVSAVPARSETPQTPSSKEAAAPVPLEASLSEVGPRADQAAEQLRRMGRSLADTERLLALASIVQGRASRAATLWGDTASLLASASRRNDVDSLVSAWQALRLDLERLGRALDTRSLACEAAAKALASMHGSWDTTLDTARQSGAPSAVVSRSETILATIDAMSALVEQRRDRLLILRDSVTSSIQGCDDAIARLLEARSEQLRRMLSSRAPGIWRLDLAALAGAGALDALRASAAERIAETRGHIALYLGAHRRACVVTSLLVVALTVAQALVWRRVQAVRRQDPLLASRAEILRAPAAAAILVAIVVTRPLRAHAPPELAEVVLLISVPAMLALLRPLLDAATLRSIYALAGLLVLDLVREFLRLPPGIEQPVLVVELGALTWILPGLARELASLAGAGFVGASGLPSATQWALRTLAVVAGAGTVAALIGYLDLADFVGRGAIVLSYLSLGLLAFRAAADAVVAFSAVTGPLAHVHAIGGPRRLVERRIGRVLDFAAAALWIGVGLQLFDLRDPALDLLAQLLAARVQLGGLDFTMGRVLAFPLIVLGAYLVARLTVFAFEQGVSPRLELPRGVSYALASLMRYGLLLLGFLLGLAALGLDLTHLTVLVSAFGLGLGFGLQQIVNNFISGLVLLFERPVQVGHSVQLDGLVGEVLRIGIRSSIIQTPNGAEVIVPNSSMIQERVTNWTLSNRRRRLDLNVGVAYGSEAKRVIALLVDIAGKDPRVRLDPEPEALFLQFGESSLDFQLRVWTEDPRWQRLQSDLCVALQAALGEAGIELPFPQRDLHIRSLPPGAAPHSSPASAPHGPA